VVSQGQPIEIIPPSGDPAPFFDSVRLRGVLWRRSLAYLIDLAIIGLLVSLVILLLSPFVILSLGLLASPVMFLVGLVPLAYHTLLIGGPRSATFGQRLFGVMVVSGGGGRPSYLQALVLTILFYLSMSVTSGLILVIMPFTRYRQGVHDLVANTVVLRTL
jgi:uncharacterized RDD family membrane protein YckC